MFSPESLSFHIVSLGCSKNLVDSEKLNGALIDAGFSAAESAEIADILIINTCGFIEDAKKESIETIFDACTIERKRNKDFTPKLVVAGCLSKRYARELREEIPEIDFLYGVIDEHFLPSMCRALGIRMKKTRFRQEPLIGSPSYAYIKISEGCSNNCSYCAIPIIRGKAQPYPPKKILNDVQEALSRGVKELIIVAQDIAAYRYHKTTLPALLKKICKNTDVPWIRLMYCHPDHVNDELIDCMAREKRICRYLDLPFQHASTKVLRSMGRKGTAETYIALVEKLRSKIPGIHIRSTFMVGYPGETDEDFQTLIDFIAAARLERVGCFMYSPEEGTRAYEMKDDIPRRVKRARYNRLLTVQKRISSEAMRGMIGKKVAVIVEERSGKNRWIGRSEYDAPEVDGIFFLTSKSAELHSIVEAEVTGAAEYDLFGVSK